MTQRIAILGAESTGKTQLSQDIAAHLRGHGLRAVAVAEALREWSTRMGRAPRPQEQLAIAQEQERRTDEAAVAHDFVIADASALMVAVYAGMRFEEGELYRFALERQRSYQATLVTGLDLPWVADGLHREAGSREQVDALVRSHLQRAGVAFQVVYGSGAQRLRSALQALGSAGVLPAHVVEREPAEGSQRAWTWVCEKCSDPACEHRLFTQLRERGG